MEPLSVAVHAVAKLAQVRTNQTVAIFGCGPVGLLCMAVAKALGANRIIAVDIVPSRLEFAKEYAATDTFLPPSAEASETKMAFSKRVASLMKVELALEERGPNSVDVVVDASGAEVCIQMGIFLSKIGGVFVQVNLHYRSHYIIIFSTFFFQVRDGQSGSPDSYNANSNKRTSN